MPFARAFDPNGEIFSQYRQEGIGVVVLLAGDAECREKTGRDLRAFYSRHGLEVIHLPIADFSVPDKANLEEAAREALENAENGQNIAIHCFYGVGRTGLFAACMAKKKLELAGEAAIQWVRQFIPEAVERPDQVQMVIEF